MADLSIFRKVFDAYAENGYIGDPRGEPAYGYLRVSSAGQAEEGRSGLPRQIQNVHAAAKEHGYSIAWNCVFADDDSGFEFDTRPELNKLRREYRLSTRKANAVVMENIDRLSRNSDWHQGFLLDEMRKYNIEVVFWKSFNSRVERAVMGAIAQDGMEQAKERMAEGNIIKAQSGRVTARVAAYGYKLVDSTGKSDNAKTDTHYAIQPEEAAVVQYIFRRVAYDGVSTRSLANELEQHYKPPKRMQHWETRLITLMIKNPVYKGEFASHRVVEEKIWVENNENGPYMPGKYVIKRRYRPQEEWIWVQVPAIVDVELWEAANRMLAKNAQMGRRNAKEPFLLTGILRCATCGYSIVGSRREMHKRGKTYRVDAYRCSGRYHRMPVVIREIGCNQSQISCRALDNSVWSVLCSVLLDPSILLEVLERQYRGDDNDQLTKQIKYLEDAIRGKDFEDEKLYRAYQADVFDAVEYRERRQLLKDAKDKLVKELANVKKQTLTPEQYQRKRDEIMSICRRAQTSGVAVDAPFEVRQRTIKSVVDRIFLNANEGWFKIEGVINGKFPIIYLDGRSAMAGGDNGDDGGDGNGDIVSIPRDRGSSRRPT